jgi:myosin heavy subunit
MNERLQGGTEAMAAVRGVDDGGDGSAGGSMRWIGLLDAFGFELLQSNSFEQLLINATNEYLQQFFLKCVMTAEQALYESEQIEWTPLS